MQAPVAVVSCSAQKAVSKVAAVAAAAAIAVAAPMVAPEEAFARDVQPYAGLTPCKKNKAFAKREKQELKEGDCCSTDKDCLEGLTCHLGPSSPDILSRPAL